jgi:uncharacterized protein (TIGR00369 family)
MKDQQHFRGLEALYLAAPTNQYFKPSIRIEEGSAEIAIPLREDFFHTAGAVHGAVYFKALDDAAFFAANSLVDDVFVLTASFQLYFLRPIQTGEIVSTGRVVSQSSRVILAESIAKDSDGNEVARGSGSFMKSKLRLDAIDSYTRAFAGDSSQ